MAKVIIKTAKIIQCLKLNVFTNTSLRLIFLSISFCVSVSFIVQILINFFAIFGETSTVVPSSNLIGNFATSVRDAILSSTLQEGVLFSKTFLNCRKGPTPTPSAFPVFTFLRVKNVVQLKNTINNKKTCRWTGKARKVIFLYGFLIVFVCFVPLPLYCMFMYYVRSI